jgi:Zn-dependent protease
MNPWFWLFVWVLAVIGSVVFHEWAHVVVAKAYGWKYNGITFKWWVAGVGVKLESEDKRGLWAIAAAGPIATFLAAFIFFYMSAIPVEGLQLILPSLVALNIAIGLINLVPSPITDGGHIITGLTGWPMKWRYTIYLWIGAELLIVWYWFI